MDLPGLLEGRAAGDPEAPWLFFRRGLDWRWRSYRHVADQVRRSASALGALDDAGAVPCGLAQDPDALAALVAILGAGRSPAVDAGSVPAVGAEGATPWLEPCRGHLERVDLAAVPAPRSPWVPADAVGARFGLRLARDAEHFAALVRPALKGLGPRAILYAGVAGSADRLGALAAWSLGHDAPWALEPQADAFAATALWTRPHVLVAAAGELASLVPHFGKAERRHSRLRAAVVVETVGDGGSSDAQAVDIEGRLGCPALRWPAGAGDGRARPA
ncbi:MAG: hypothetical protein AAGF23_04970 [Acidobacteriota bacterium]